MSAMRRTGSLAAFAAVGLALVMMTEPPPRRTARELLRGPRPFRISTSTVRRIELAVATRRVGADRTGDGWRTDAVPASPVLRDALDTLVDELARLRAVDAFRPSSLSEIGLDPPTGSIVVTTPRGVQRLELGALNTGGSTFYARRDGHGRVLQLGVYLLELVRRVFDAREADAGHARSRPASRSGSRSRS